MQRFLNTAKRFIKSEDGPTATEYAVMLSLIIVAGSAMWRTKREQFINRVEAAGLYWHFVDLVWIFLFPVLYLL